MTTESLHQVPTRLDVDAAVPAFSKAMAHLDTTATRELDRVGIPAGLRDLIRLRASQLNGCAYCVDTHSKDAADNGESQQRVHAVSVWAESPFFTEKERVAFRFAESVTRLTETHVPTADYDRAKTLLESLHDQIHYQALQGATDVVKISAIGVGMRSHAGVAARAFRALSEKGINIRAITTSEIKFSVLIDAAYTELAVRTLHSLYGLDAA